MNYRFRKVYYTRLNYCQICQLNIVPLCYVAGKQALFKAPVVKKMVFTFIKSAKLPL